MALRFLADHCISNTTIRTLQDAGHEVFRLRELMATDSPDRLVIAKQSVPPSVRAEQRPMHNCAPRFAMRPLLAVKIDPRNS